MKNRVEKPDKEGQSKPRPGVKTSPQVTHPIIQLQQTVGNKAVANIIQRQKSEKDDKGLFRLEGIPTNNNIQTTLMDKIRGASGGFDEKWKEGSERKSTGNDSGMKGLGDSGDKWSEEDFSGKSSGGMKGLGDSGDKW